jgi:uncharacterized protein DUF6982
VLDPRRSGRADGAPGLGTGCGTAECRHCTEGHAITGPGAKVVVRYADGRLTKGYSYDFGAGRKSFHVFSGPNASGRPTSVPVSELKAVFFVRDFVGNGKYTERKGFENRDRAHGRAIELRFHDGEVLVGSTGDPQAGPGILFTPADPASNNIRVYAVWAAVRQMRVLPARSRSAPATRPSPPTRLPAWLQQPLTIPWSLKRSRAT